MSSNQRSGSIRRLTEMLLSLRPHPRAMYEAIEQELPRMEDFVGQDEIANSYAGMTAEQVSELAADPLFSVGVHTVDHPFLTKCGREEAVRQIRENKDWIETVCNKECHTIAYTGGDYNVELLEECRELGFFHGYALNPIFGVEGQLELPRMGIYSTSLNILGFKVQWGNHMRALRLEVG